MLKNSIILFILAVATLIIFIPSYRKMQDLERRNSELQLQIKQLKDKNTELAEEKRKLDDDPVYLEKVAREKLGIAREGEVIYKITPEAVEQK